MMKIKNYIQLRKEKQRLKERQNILEQQLHQNWNSFKGSLHPHNIAAHLLANLLHSNTNGNRYQGISEKAGNIIGQLAKIAIEKLEQKIADWLARK